MTGHRATAPRTILEATNESVWLVNRAGATVLCCSILDAAERGLRLRVPAGYGVGVGQHYEVSPAESYPRVPVLRVAPHSRWVQVTEISENPVDHHDHVCVDLVYETEPEDTMSVF